MPTNINHFTPKIMNNTPTPRTDAELFLSRGMGIVPTLPKEVVRAGFSKTLERELTAVTEQRDRLAEAQEMKCSKPNTQTDAPLTRPSPSLWPCPPKKSRSAKLLVEATYRRTGAACVLTDGERPPWTMRVHFPTGQAFSFHPSRVDDWFILHNRNGTTKPAIT